MDRVKDLVRPGTPTLIWPGYAVGLIAHKPAQLTDLGDRVVNAVQEGDAPVPDLLFVLLTVVMFVVRSLRLALSRGLTGAMGGTLRPDTTPEGGLTIVLALPASETAEPAREEGSAPPGDLAGRVSRHPLSRRDAK
jgi:hypothetical protein